LKQIKKKIDIRWYFLSINESLNLEHCDVSDSNPNEYVQTSNIDIISWDIGGWGAKTVENLYYKTSNMK
jgi:hypothetical protein